MQDNRHTKYFQSITTACLGMKNKQKTIFKKCNASVPQLV